MNNRGWGSFDSLRSLASAPDDLRGSALAGNDLRTRVVPEIRTAPSGGALGTISLRMAKGLGKVAAGFVLAGRQLRHG